MNLLGAGAPRNMLRGVQIQGPINKDGVLQFFSVGRQAIVDSVSAWRAQSVGDKLLLVFELLVDVIVSGIDRLQELVGKFAGAVVEYVNIFHDTLIKTRGVFAERANKILRRNEGEFIAKRRVAWDLPGRC
jgi:hypothetical protein